MNATDFNDALIPLKNGLNILKLLKDLLPSNKKPEVEQQLKEAENNLGQARALFARELGFKICECDLPPGIFLFKRERNLYECDKCGHTMPYGSSHLQAKIIDF